MKHDTFSREQLIKKVEELEMLNKQLLAEKAQELKLEYAWSGNLGHWYWNIKTNSVTFNPLKVTNLGYDKAEIPEVVNYQFFTEKLHPDDYQKTMDAMNDHLYGKADVYEVDYRIQTKNGDYKWYYDRGKITQYDEKGNPAFLAGIVFDISKKKEMQQELIASKEELAKKAEDRYQILFNSIDEGFFIIEKVDTKPGESSDYRYIITNPAFERITGHKGIEGKTVQSLKPKLDDHLLQIYDSVIETKQPIRVETYVGVIDIWISGYAFPIDEYNNKSIAVLFNDISNRKKAEDMLRESEKQALSVAEQLKKADQNKNEFINLMSHELRNPMAVILASLSLLEITQDMQQIETAKETMRRQIKHLCKLVDQLLDLIRLNNNKIQLKKEKIELNRLALIVAQDHKPLFNKKEIVFETLISPNALYSCADPLYITQIIENLLSNALKFTNKDGKVTLQVNEVNGEAVISIKDTGIGIENEMLDELFKPFVQADTSLARSTGGLGLGLNIAKNNAELHGGTIKAFSEGLGKGSTFDIYLPIIQKMKVEHERDTFSGETVRNFRILLIEDNQDYAVLLKIILQAAGHDVAIAFDGQEGIKKSREFNPEVIICDIGMPDLNGYEVAKILREDDSLNKVFLIALTGYASQNDIEKTINAGFDLHVTKPIDSASINIILSKVKQI